MRSESATECPSDGVCHRRTAAKAVSRMLRAPAVKQRSHLVDLSLLVGELANSGAGRTRLNQTPLSGEKLVPVPKVFSILEPCLDHPRAIGTIREEAVLQILSSCAVTSVVFIAIECTRHLYTALAQSVERCIRAELRCVSSKVVRPFSRPPDPKLCCAAFSTLHGTVTTASASSRTIQCLHSRDDTRAHIVSKMQAATHERGSWRTSAHPDAGFQRG